jgi:hypothetical protein
MHQEQNDRTGDVLWLIPPPKLLAFPPLPQTLLTTTLILWAFTPPPIGR